jgi:hypothetical protein
VSGAVPVDGEIAVIPADTHILLDVQETANLGQLHVYSTLEFLDTGDRTLHAISVHIAKGGMVRVGSPEARFQNRATIKLYGDRDTPEFINLGAKAIGVFGSLRARARCQLDPPSCCGCRWGRIHHRMRHLPGLARRRQRLRGVVRQ